MKTNVNGGIGYELDYYWVVSNDQTYVVPSDYPLLVKKFKMGIEIDTMSLLKVKMDHF